MEHNSAVQIHYDNKQEQSCNRIISEAFFSCWNVLLTHFKASRNKINWELINQFIIDFGVFLSKQKASLSCVKGTGVVWGFY